MPDTNNDQFDLPRWHTTHKSSEISSPAYFYPHHVDSTDSHSALARSASFSGTSSSSARGRRHSLLNSDSDNMAARQTQPNFYQQSPNYPNGPPPNSAPAADPYPDMYYPPKRIQPIDSNPQPTRPGRSPMRVPNTPLSDPYAQQAQYSPTAQYNYGPPPPQTQYSHNRNLSHPKHEPMTPPIPPSYASPPSTHPSAPYTSPFAMDTSSPHPSQSQSHLTAAQSSSRAHSLSNPSTPLSYIQSSNSQYYSDHPMAVDPPPPKRRASGFRRVRTVHDLQPRVDSGSLNRRVTSDGVFLSVRPLFFFFLFWEVIYSFLLTYCFHSPSAS